MSQNQSRYEKADRSGGFNHQRQFSGGVPTKGGGGASHAPTNRSFKYNNYVPVPQPGAGTWNVDSGNPSTVQNVAHQQHPTRRVPEAAAVSKTSYNLKPTDASTLMTTRPVPKSPSSNVTNAGSEAKAVATHGRDSGDASKSFPLQFGSISPVFMNGVQMPPQTRSAPPNLDEQKKDQARSESSRAAPTLPIQYVPKQQFLENDAGILDQPNSCEDKWNKFPGSLMGGRGDMWTDAGYMNNVVGLRPGQGGKSGVLRNPRAQSPQYAGGILSGPMQSVGPQGGMHQRNDVDSDRWQQGTGFQKGLAPYPQTPNPMMHKAEKKYEVGKVSDEEEAKQRQLKAILNKLTPQNFEKLFEQVKQVNIDNVITLSGLISQIFDKALMEPTFCEMYANFCYHLAVDLPDLSVDNEKITFKRLLLNKCQEEFERGEKDEEEANKAEEEGEVKQSAEEREEKRLCARRRMLGSIRLIGELYKKRMLTERIMHECINKLLGQYQNPDEENIEALCELMSTVGEMIDHPKAKEHIDAYYDMMGQLSNNMKLSSRVRFMLTDAIDLRKNQWQQRIKVEGLKKIEVPMPIMHKAEKKYEVGKVSDEEEAKQRQLKAILNKLTPQNFERLFEQVKQVNIDNVITLSGVISQIFDKALMEPTFCEMYANFCYHLAVDLPDLSVDNEKITFKRLLLNKFQEEFERGEREEEEANKVEEEGEVKQSAEEREEKRLRARRRMLGNIRLIGELYKKRMLTGRIMHECIKKLLGQYQNPDEENIEALCELMSTVGEMIDHPKAKEHIDAYYDMMGQLSNNMKLSSRVRFMLKDAIDLRKNQWQQRIKGEGLKKIEVPMPIMHKAEKKYEVGKVSDEEEAKQRQLKAILNKLTPQNFEKLFEQVKQVNIDNVITLSGVISQIFDKALMEPTFCEMYANFCYHLAVDLPDLSVDNEKITFKRLLLNKFQEEFERGEREEEEANKVEEEGEVKQSAEEREEKRLRARRRMLGNIRLIGELYKKRMLTGRIMHECIKKLLGQYQNPDEENIEALCELMSTVGEMIDHPKAKEHIDAYYDMMGQLSNNMKLSSRVRFMLKDAIDLRKNQWQQRIKGEGLKKIEVPMPIMHKAEKKYEVGKVSDEEEAKQRQLKAILNKLTPQNFEKLFEQVKQVNIDNVITLSGVISQIFDKALMEPTFCEMYANFCYHLAVDLPDLSVDNEKITFKRLLLNKFQEEFERGEREEEEANKVEEEGEVKQSAEEREEKRLRARRRMLGNIRLIGELYKKRMLTGRIMHECIKKLLGQYQNPDEENIEALCELMSTVGEMIDHPKAKEHIDAYYDMMGQLSNNMKLSSRVRFMLKDAIDLRKNQWQQRIKGEGLKKIEVPMPIMHKAEKKYEVGKVSDEEEAKQRQLKAILNKLTPQNFEKLFEQVKQVNIDNVITLSGVISQIFDKALMEPTFCEMYANFCYHLAVDLPDLSVDNEKITFKRLLLNKFQEEFERGEREEEEANKVEEEGEVKQSAEERGEKRLRARRRMLGNIRLIGELYKKRMLTERIMHECIKKLLGQYQNPDEENIEALCKLMSTIGEMIDHPKAKEHIDAYYDMMGQLSNNMKLSSRVRFMLKDAIDLRKNKWQQRRKVEGPKKIEEVHRHAAQERPTQSSRLGQAPSMGNSSCRAILPSPNSQIGNFCSRPPHLCGNGGSQDARIEERHSSVPLLQRALGDDSKAGLQEEWLSEGSPLAANVPLAEMQIPGDGRRTGPGQNGFSSVSERTGYGQREDLMPRYMQDRSVATPTYDQSHPQEWNITQGNRDVRSDCASDGALPTSPSPRGGPPSVTHDVSSDKVWPEEQLRDKSLAAIKEFYSTRDEKEVALCIKDLNAPSFYPSMISIWVTDSFERKDMERDALTKLLINLSKPQDRTISEDQLVKGFESVLEVLEDAVNDAPRAAEFLGRMFAKIILENVISLSNIGKLIREGGEEKGRLVEVGIAAEVLGSILDIIESEKGEFVLNEIRSSSNLRVEDFGPVGSSKKSRIDKYITT